MKKSTMAVAALLTVLAAPMVSVAYADEDSATTASSCTKCTGCKSCADKAGCKHCSGHKGCKACNDCSTH